MNNSIRVSGSHMEYCCEIWLSIITKSFETSTGHWSLKI